MHRLISALLAGCLLAGVSPDEFSQAKKSLSDAANKADAAAFDAALEILIRDDSRRAATFLTSRLEKLQGRFYWRVIESLSRIGSRDGVAAVESAVRNGKKNADLMLAIVFNTSRFGDEAIARIADRGRPDLQRMAVDELIRRGTAAHVKALIGLVDRKKNIGAQARKGLRVLTGKHFERAAEWEAWWADKRAEYRKPAAPQPSKGPGRTVAESRLQDLRPDLEELKKGNKDEIVVVRGRYDEVETVLSALSIPHKVITRLELERADLSRCSALLVNCDEYILDDIEGVEDLSKVKTEGTLSDAAIRVLRRFVLRGGSLYASDIVLPSIIKAFPGFLEKTGELRKKAVVGVRPAPGQGGHPLLRGVFRDGNGRPAFLHKWRVGTTGFSYLFRPVGRRATVLVECDELQGVGPRGRAVKQNAVVAAFRPGQSKAGRVLFVLWHFADQKMEELTYHLQGVLVNFLVEARD